MSDPDRKHLVKKDDTPPVTVEHPLNPQSEMSIRLLSAGTGMNRLGISEGRLTQGKEAFVYDVIHKDSHCLLELRIRENIAHRKEDSGKNALRPVKKRGRHTEVLRYRQSIRNGR